MGNNMTVANRHWLVQGKLNQPTWAIGIRIIFALIAFYLILVSAWVGDDAQITFRQIWNFINGDGITFNFEERVQAFTHPLWFLVLSTVSFATREIFLTAILVSSVFSILAILLLLRIELSVTWNRLVLVSPVFLLLFSRSFYDYTTSGLENALSCFLIGLLLLQFTFHKLTDRLKLIYLILALLVLNRLDYSIMFLPLALVLVPLTKSPLGFLKVIWPGALLLASWFIFATFYFGSPLPNTFYAKLSANYPFDEVIQHGRRYFLSLRLDHVTTIFILTSMFLSIVSRNRILLALNLGLIAYLSYIIFIGGDFMLGRFFAVPAYLSVGLIVLAIVLSRKGREGLANLPILIFVVITIGISTIRGVPFLTGTEFTAINQIGDIYDERGHYYRQFGLFSPHRTSWPAIEDQSDIQLNRYGTSCVYIGGHSLFNTSYHLIDNCALSDPFLSRLPAIGIKDWKIGHHLRKVPQEYGEFLLGNVTQIPDRKLNSLLQDINSAVRGDLFSIDRIAAIYRLNTGYYANLDTSSYKDPDLFIPITSQTEELHITNWDENLVFEKLPQIIDHRFRRFNNSIKIISATSKIASGLILDVGKSFTYDVFVNDMKVAKLDGGGGWGENQVVHLQTISFPTPISVKSITLVATDAIYEHSPNFNIIKSIILEPID